MTAYRGFYDICNEETMKLFRYDELELLICGNPVLDYNELKNGSNPAYNIIMSILGVKFGPENSTTASYTENCKQVLNFWKVVSELDDNDFRKLLQFATGR